MNKVEICRLNRIHSGVVFPGQTIRVKDPAHPDDYVPPPQRSLSTSSVQEASGESESVTITTEDNQGRPKVTEIMTEQSLEFVNNTMFRVKSLYLTVDKGTATSTSFWTISTHLSAQNRPPPHPA